MKLFVFVLVFCFAQCITAQNSFLAKQYFDDGDFEKAVVFYEKLVEENPRRTDYYTNLISCYQQLERYDAAEGLIVMKLQELNAHPVYYIELGHNYTLQGKDTEATKNYEIAYESVLKNPNNGYGIGYRFQGYSLLDYASKTYIKAMELNPKFDFNFQLARIYGEQGAIEKMFGSFLALVAQDKDKLAAVIRSIDDFISSDAKDENNIKFKRAVLKQAQNNPDVVWNELLSWLFIEQKQYNSAFNQEKAIYKRSEEGNLKRLNILGNIALKEGEKDTAKDIFSYIVDNSIENNTTLNAQLHIIAIDLELSDDKQLDDAQKSYESLLETYGYKSSSLLLFTSYANFLTFKKETPTQAIAILKKALELPLNKYSKAYVKMALGDILVYHKKFNEALIYFTQIQKELKNDVLGQNARYKVAQASFYKGDFDWALNQLKVLRSSTSQLIANDAMQLSLLISDNSLQDSTQTALKKYATADLLAYQNKTMEAITVLDDILINHKGEKIEDEALLKQGQLLEKLKKYEEAEFNYLKIVEFYGNDILADDAHYALGEMYLNVFDNIEKAKYHYEKIIYSYQDSYYFPTARKEFRKLRGDIIN